MSTQDFEVGDYIFQLMYTSFDLYMTSPLGCHAGSVGSFSTNIKWKDPVNQKKGFAVLDEATCKLLVEKDMYRKIMERLVKVAEEAFGGWTGGKGTGYHKKGHWIISAPWNREPKKNSFDLGTCEIMDLIAQFCDAEPAKYGRYMMTEATDCAAHGNNSNKPATRTMVWHPPYVGINPVKVTTSLSGGVYTKPAPKKGDPQPPVVKEVKPPKWTKGPRPPRPVRREFAANKVPKKYGPPATRRYARAA